MAVFFAVFAAQIFAASAMRGTGSTPVSAMRPAKTETIAGVSGSSALTTSRTCCSVRMAVMFSFTPAFERRSISGIDDSFFVFVIGIFT